MTWEIEQVQDSCRLTVVHDQLRDGAHGEIYGGWPQILSGLKTLLETGETAHDAGLADVHAGAARPLLPDPRDSDDVERCGPSTARLCRATGQSWGWGTIRM